MRRTYKQSVRGGIFILHNFLYVYLGINKRVTLYNYSVLFVKSSCTLWLRLRRPNANIYILLNSVGGYNMDRVVGTYVMGKHSSPFRLLYDRSFATVAVRGL